MVTSEAQELPKNSKNVRDAQCSPVGGGVFSRPVLSNTGVLGIIYGTGIRYMFIDIFALIIYCIYIYIHTYIHYIRSIMLI